MSNWFSEPMKDEVPYSDIEEKAENGEFHEWKHQPFDFTENGYEDLIPKLKEYTAIKYLGYQDLRDKAKENGDIEGEKKYQAEMDRMVNEVYDIYRTRDIYPTLYFSEMGIMQEIERCIAYKAFWDGNVVSCGAGIGTTLCKYLFPNLQDTPSKHDLDKKGAESIFAKFHNEEYLKRAIKFCFSYKNGCPVPTAVEGGLRLVGSAPSNFRPMNAKAIYERFTPEGGTIYDFCCVSGDTEYFNGTEWKRIDKYENGDLVLQYNEDGTSNVVSPLEYIHYRDDSPFYENDNEWLPTKLTGNHDVVYYDEDSSLKKMKFNEVLERTSKGETIDVPIASSMKDNHMCSVTVCDSILREIISGYLSNKIIKGSVSSKFLVKSGFRHVILSDKVFSLVEYQRQELLKGILKLKVNADEIEDFRVLAESKGILDARIIESLCRVTSGFSKVGYDWFKPEFVLNEYTLRRVSRPVISVGNNSESYDSDTFTDVIVSHEEDKYCFVVPSHMLVLRRKGMVFVTGNCGFGGRMLGALSSKKNFRYVGTDPNTETMYHLHQLGDYVEQVTGRDDSYELHCIGSEDFRGSAESIDFAFSSPPYFDLEVYSDEPTQCYNKFPNLKDWLEGYVRQTIKNIGYMLKPGCCYAVNIADFTVGGSETVAYVDEWIRLSTEEGMPLFDTVYLGVTARAGSMEQAAGELKKENILVFKKPLF